MKFSFRTLGCLSALVSVIFTLYLNQRQYFFAENASKTRLAQKFQLAFSKGHCSFEITSRNFKEYPNCPSVAISAILDHAKKQNTLLVGAFHSFSVGIVPVILYSTNLYEYLINYITTELIPEYIHEEQVYFVYNYVQEFSVGLLNAPLAMYMLISKLTSSPHRKVFTLSVTLLYYLIIMPTVIACTKALACTIFGYLSAGKMDFLGFSGISLCSLLLAYYCADYHFDKNFNVKILSETKYFRDFGPLADRLAFPKDRILIVQSSEKYPQYTYNAFLAGCLGTYGIFVFDGLLKVLTVPELKGILCHELGHWELAHANKKIIFLYLETILYYFLVYYFVQSPLSLENFSPSIGSGLDVDGVSVIQFEHFVFSFKFLLHIRSVMKSFYSKYCELQSDIFSVYFGLGEELKLALTKTDKLFERGIVDPWVNKFIDTHPLTIERHKAIDIATKNLKRNRRSRRTLLKQ